MDGIPARRARQIKKGSSPAGYQRGLFCCRAGIPSNQSCGVPGKRKFFRGETARRARQIKKGTIPSTEEGQQAQLDSLVDASTIDLSVMGQQGGGAGGRGQMGQHSTDENTSPTAPTEEGALAEEQVPEEGAAPSESTMPEEGAPEEGNAPDGMGRPEDIAPEMPGSQQEQQGQMQEEMNSDPETMPEEPSGFGKARVPGFSQETGGESQGQNRENLIWLGSSLLLLLLALVFVLRYRRKKVS